MNIVETQQFFSKIQFPCTYEELLVQCELENIDELLITELAERFAEEWAGTGEYLSEEDFEEYEGYFHQDYVLDEEDE